MNSVLPPLLPMEACAAEVFIENFKMRYGDMTEPQILESLKYSDEYYCFMSPLDSRLAYFRDLSADMRKWYNLLQITKGEPFSQDACMVYTKVQQDSEQVLQEINEVGKELNCEVFGYKTTNLLTQYILHPRVVTEEKLRHIQERVTSSVAYWGSSPPVLSYLSAYPFKYDPNKKPEPCGHNCCC